MTVKRLTMMGLYPIMRHILEEGVRFRGTIIIKKEEEWFVATCLENDIASQGKTMDEALANVKEAIALYYEDETNEDLGLDKNHQIFITTLEMAL